MRKALVIFTTILMLVLLLTCLALYLVTQGPYTTQAVNHLLDKYSKGSMSVYNAQFVFPNHLTLQGVEVLNLQEDPINIEQVDLWINSSTYTQLRPEFDSVLINGLLLQSGIPSVPVLDNVRLHQLAITNLDYSDGSFISRDTNIQILNPNFSNRQQLPYGSIQFSAEQIYWQREAFNKVLVDIDYKEENSTIYGASFEWRGGNISSQAEQYKDGWSLVNTTIEQLRLSFDKWVEIDTTDWSFIFDKINHINSLDILSSSIETEYIQVVNGNLSVENVSLTNGLWQQQEGYISFGAESIKYLNHLLLEPAFESYFDMNLTSLEVLSFEFKQGLVKTSGELTPSSVYLKDLDINGIKWIYENPEDFSSLSDYLFQLDSLIIDDIKIRNTQFIQIAQQPNWQLSGLSVNGEDLILLRGNRIGLWDGKLQLSANNASFQQLLTSQPLIKMQSSNGVWQLNEAFIPLEKGLIDATATYTLSKPSQPWRLEAFVDGVPIQAFSKWLPLPAKTEAIAEFQLGLQGLGGDDLMLRHSLTGQLVGSLRESVLIKDTERDIVQDKRFETSEISLSADRGRITLHPVTIEGKAISGKLEGTIDLVQEGKNQLTLLLNNDCTEHTFDLLTNGHKMVNSCSQEHAANQAQVNN